MRKIATALNAPGHDAACLGWRGASYLSQTAEQAGRKNRVAPGVPDLREFRTNVVRELAIIEGGLNHYLRGH
jgi:hypothetical protein